MTGQDLRAIREACGVTEIELSEAVEEAAALAEAVVFAEKGMRAWDRLWVHLAERCARDGPTVPTMPQVYAAPGGVP